MFAKDFDLLPDQCKHCLNRQIYSVRMDGNHSYSCRKYPLIDKQKICPCYEGDPTEGEHKEG